MKNKIETISLWDRKMVIEKYCKPIIEKKFHVKVEVCDEMAEGINNPIIKITGPAETIMELFVKDYCSEKTIEDELESADVTI